MKKNLLKTISLFCAFAMCMPAAACGGDETGEQQVDKTKAQLYVSNYDGGVGSDWLRDELIPRFQAEYAEKEFIPGTKGVQVWVTPHRKGLADIGPKLSTAKEEVYFLEDVNYYQGISEGYFLDITDIVTEKMTKYGETESIEDKLYDDQVNFYKAPNGKYYGLPHSQSPTLLTYDADLFEENGLYFGADGKLGKKSTDTLSNGPDGKPNTYDDGLPATYAQFFELCERMTKRGIAPMIWSGAYPFYSTDFSIGLRADFEGAEASLAYNFEGTATHLVEFDANGKAKIDANGNITYRDPVEITVENGYEVFTSAGYYYAYSFLETIYKNHYYSDYSFNEGVSHEGAQDYFLLANKDNDMDDIGMLVEGVYWVNEAKQTFKDMSSYPNSSLQERNLKVMPMPKATEAQIGETPTFMDSLNHLAFISAYIEEEKVELAKTFLQYCQTQVSLENFILNTNFPRCYDVDYTAHGNTTSYNAMVAEAVKNIKAAILADTDSSLFSLTQMDTKTWCNCSACSALKTKYGTDAASQIIFVNDVTEIIQEWLETEQGGREVQFAIFAYYTTKTAPATQNADGSWTAIDSTVVLNDNVSVWIAPIEDDFRININTANTSNNMRKMIESWSACASSYFIWAYDTYFNNYMIPYDTYDAMQDMVRFCAEYNTKFFYSLGAWDLTQNTSFGDLKDYLYAKLMWNCNLDVNTLIDNFFQDVYKEAGTTMKTVFEAWRTKSATFGGNIYSSSDSWYEIYATFDNNWLKTQLGLLETAISQISGYKTTNEALYNAIYDSIVAESISLRYLYKQRNRSEYSSTAWGTLANDAARLGVNKLSENTDF